MAVGGVVGGVVGVGLGAVVGGTLALLGLSGFGCVGGVEVRDWGAEGEVVKGGCGGVFVGGVEGEGEGVVAFFSAGKANFPGDEAGGAATFTPPGEGEGGVLGVGVGFSVVAAVGGSCCCAGPGVVCLTGGGCVALTGFRAFLGRPPPMTAPGIGNMETAPGGRYFLGGAF